MTLSIDTKTAVVGALLEGASIRSAERQTGVSRGRIGKLILGMGQASERLLDETIRGFRCEQLELDEIVINTWTFDPAARRHSYTLLAKAFELS